MIRALSRLVLSPIAALLAAVVGNVASAQSLPRTVFRSVTVIPMDRPGKIVGQDVVVELDRVVAMGDAGSIPVQDTARVIDGAGKFLMPGLWDMHIHMASASGGSSRDYLDNLTLLHVYGIAGARDMGMPLTAMNEARRLVALDPLHSPELIAAGPMINGKESEIPRIVRFATDAGEARAMVREHVGAGADFIKVHDDLTREQHDAVMEEAKAAGVAVAGHVPIGLTAEEVASSGQRSIERISLKLLDACSADGSRAEPEMLDAMALEFFEGRYREIVAWYPKRNPEACQALYARLAETGVFVTPMLSSELLGAPWSDDAGEEDMPTRYQVPCERFTQLAAAAPGREAAAEALFAVVRELHRGGVPLLAGSEAPAYCAAMGRGLHRELRLLRAAGLSNQAVLETATSNAARYLGRDDEGVVRAGAKANLVLLDADPLEDIANTLHIDGLMRHGLWQGRERLDSLKRSAQ